jgi:hypothetical protein
VLTARTRDIRSERGAAKVSLDKGYQEILGLEGRLRNVRGAMIAPHVRLTMEDADMRTILPNMPIRIAGTLRFRPSGSRELVSAADREICRVMGPGPLLEVLLGILYWESGTCEVRGKKYELE